MERNVYLKTVTLEEALTLFNEKMKAYDNHKTEWLPVDKSYGRITASAVYAKLSNPNFNAAAMDGIMVRSEATFEAHERNPVLLSLPQDFIYTDTGDVVQDPYDSVIMIEDVEVINDNQVKISAASHPWQHIRMIGEDLVIGEMILASGHRIEPEDIGALISGGIFEVEVLSLKTVGIIPTGSEIVEIGTDMKPGDILDGNSRMFYGMVLASGGIPKRYGIVPDDRVLLKEAILNAVSENDLVVINAGSSAGSEDYTVGLIRELGEVWVHGIDIKPGKPTILGAIDQKPVIGIPGYPVSAYMAFKHFVVPMIDASVVTVQNKVSSLTPINEVEVTLTRRIVSSLKHKEFVRMQVGFVDGRYIATPLNRGAGATMSLVKSNAILTIPKEVEGIEAGTKVAVTIHKKAQQIQQTLVSIGSHDLLMDWLTDLFEINQNGYHLMSAHVGSLGGIMAIKKGEAHMAPIHLLDPETGIYNTSYVQQYFKDEPMLLIKGIRRYQGYYTRTADDQVTDFQQLIERDYRFINRQKGSGTRLLTDYLIKKAGINASQISGYDSEVLTHTGIALAVKSGNADIGIGVESVARQMGLCYTPIGTEDYDFLIPKKNIESEMVKAFLELLASDAFKERLEAAGGYEYRALEMIEIGG